MTDDDRPRCGRPVPEALRGSLEPGPCRLTVVPGRPHDGQHKAILTIPGFGKVRFTWFDSQNKKNDPPPEVALPKKSFPHSAFNARRSQR